MKVISGQTCRITGAKANLAGQQMSLKDACKNFLNKHYHYAGIYGQTPCKIVASPLECLQVSLPTII
jgi:hypothetical protein